MKKVYAFDVFDTCLVRKVAVPSAIFREVAVRLSLKLDATSASFVDDFVAARIDAEEVVRRQSKREEITLFEIWAQIKIVMGWSGHESLEQLELDVEDEVLVAVAAVCKKVQVARQNSGRIVFISDIYLPAKFVERQLRKHGIAQPGDGFYISSEVGMTKASGNLFRHVLDAEGVQASQMLHVGDNLHSDYSIPKGLGIVVDAFSDTCLSPGEVSLMRLNTIPAASAKVAGAMRAFRLTNDQANLARVELVSQFLAPFTMGFATWVLRQAQKDGIKRLYFLSRDCQLTWKAACELSPHFGLIDCRYLYVSRQSLLLPSTTDISPEGMSWIKSRWETKVLLKSLLAKIELTFDEVEMNFCMLAGEARGDFCVSSENDWCEFWAALNEPELRIRIQALIAKRRDSTLTYFKSAGLFDNISWAIVDLGWYLNGQSALWQILKSQGWEGRIAGYYLALKCHRRPPSSAGEATA
ncbi:MAG: hypothetical protein ABIT37_25540, partial [Luteolibacter sp.]